MVFPSQKHVKTKWCLLQPTTKTHYCSSSNDNILFIGAGKGRNGGLKVRGHVKWSDVDTASEHDASVDGNVYQSKFHNYRREIFMA